jgi:hypothetical protein
VDGDEERALSPKKFTAIYCSKIIVIYYFMRNLYSASRTKRNMFVIYNRLMLVS